MRVKIHREGINILIVLLLILVATNIPMWIFVLNPIAIPIIFSSISAIIFLLVVNFFRSPKRHFKGEISDDIVVASADGTVVALEEVMETEYLHTKCIQLSIFMTIFNVHANWFPINGKVMYVKHHSGRFMAAYLPKSSSENERSTVAIKANNGQVIVMRQIAGAMARRIVTYAEAGLESHIEDHMGFIKFGSRIDLFLPLDTIINVKLGDKTTGGVTQIATLINNRQK